MVGQSLLVMIIAKNLSKYFGPIKAVDDVSFEVKKGEVLGFLGPNGAGKTTTMKMLTGFLVPSGGAAKICNFDVSKNLIKAQEKIGYLPEGAPLYSEMTPRGFLKFISLVRGLKGAEAERALDKVVQDVGLDEVLDQQVETLSKGYQRRLGLAQALIHNPEVLILDEPTDGLDPNQKHDVRKLIRTIAKNKAIIISTHILEEVESICSRAIIINRGRIVADGTPYNLKKRSMYHNAVLLRGPVAGHKFLAQALAKLKFVGGVEIRREGQMVSLSIITKGSKPPLEAIQKTLAKTSWPVKEISVDTGRLDDVFRALTNPETRAA